MTGNSQTIITPLHRVEQIAMSVDVVNRHTENVTADSNTMVESVEGLRRESTELMDKMGKFVL